ncbi:DCST2 protein, partial [Heliornis fulica]|nr:DCST2 protein [Heliornis fulica]
RSTGGFILGMALASLYGLLALLAQGHNVWYCMVTTIVLGMGLGLGMAFSSRVRLTVLLSLPHMFTREGKTLLLLLALSVALQGPCSNILRNFSGIAESVSCGAELALNQTAERLERSKEPLLNALTRIKDLAQKAKVVGDHVRKLLRSIMDSVSHVARALHNVWLWLASVGNLCNKELGSPRRRCLKLFDEAQQNCERTLSSLFFLCYTIITFKGLCGLANIPLIFCIVPQYVQSFIRRTTTVPLKNALDRVRREFEFNISVVHRFDVNLNASKSLRDVSLDIMNNVYLSLEPTFRFLSLFTHVSFFVMLYMYIMAMRYLYRYLRHNTFDNIYITQRFVNLDLQRAKQGKPTVLPLQAGERDRYVPPTALWMSKKEQQEYLLQLVKILRHILVGMCLILADYGLYWLCRFIWHQMRAEIIVRTPAMLRVTVNGTGYSSDIFRDLMVAFN